MPLTNRRILFVEDDFLVGLFQRMSLEEAGAKVIGPAGDLTTGLRLVDEDVDAAVLDVRLGQRETSLRIADKLDRRGIPYVFVTGHSPDLPEPYSRKPVIAKPANSEKLVSALSLCLKTKAGVGPRGPAMQ